MRWDSSSRPGLSGNGTRLAQDPSASIDIRSTRTACGGRESWELGTTLEVGDKHRGHNLLRRRCNKLWWLKTTDRRGPSGVRNSISTFASPGRIARLHQLPGSIFDGCTEEFQP